MTSLRSLDSRRPRLAGGCVDVTGASVLGMNCIVPRGATIREDLLSVTLTSASEVGMMSVSRIAPPPVRSIGVHARPTPAAQGPYSTARHQPEDPTHA